MSVDGQAGSGGRAWPRLRVASESVRVASESVRVVREGVLVLPLGLLLLLPPPVLRHVGRPRRPPLMRDPPERRWALGGGVVVAVDENRFASEMGESAPTALHACSPRSSSGEYVVTSFGPPSSVGPVELAFADTRSAM